jgi:hypothetical protein
MSDERVDYPEPTNEQLADFHNNLDKRMAQLEEHQDSLPNSFSRDFAANLLQYYNKSERLSIKQTVWATKFWTWLAEKAFDNLIAAESKGTPVKKQPETVATTVVDGRQLIAHFDKAAEGKKYPNIKWMGLEDPICQKYSIPAITFYRSPGSKHMQMGEVGVGYKIGEQWSSLCAVRRDGKVQWYPFASTKLDLQQLLRKLIEEFVPQMQANGQKYKHCCFCGLELTDAPSLAAGYGPICADKWGLPWGDAPEEEIVLGVTL